MEAFLKICKTRCKIWLVNSYTIAGVMKDLAAHGHRAICFDPDEEGTGGELIPIEKVTVDAG